jgi:hypothetical protein
MIGGNVSKPEDRIPDWLCWRNRFIMDHSLDIKRQINIVLTLYFDIHSVLVLETSVLFLGHTGRLTAFQNVSSSTSS